MAENKRVQTRTERVGFSRAKKVVLFILALVIIWATCLFGGNFYAVHAGYGNLGGLLRGNNKAMPPVAVSDLQAVLDKDIAGALKSGELAPSTGAGVSIAVVEHGVTRMFSYGAAKQDSIYEVGSITKTLPGSYFLRWWNRARFGWTSQCANCYPQA